MVLKMCNAFPESRLKNFLVGVTNNAPNVVSPLNGNYSTCGQWPGAALPVAMLVTCRKDLSPARYVVIMLNNTGDTVNIAELQVYGEGMN